MNQNKNRIGLFILLGVAVMFFMIVSRPFALMFLLVLSLVGIVAGVFYTYSLYHRAKAEKAKANTVYGIIESRVEQCNDQIERNTKEVKEIRINIRDLEFRLNQAIEVKPETRQETLKVIEGFKKELALRETKIGFYNTCKRKLSTLLYNYNLAQELEKKKAKLTKLQEDNFDSVAEMENMKSDMAYDFSFVETISDLSSRMMLSNTIDKAKELQLQLIDLTSDLREM